MFKQLKDKKMLLLFLVRGWQLLLPQGRQQSENVSKRTVSQGRKKRNPMFGQYLSSCMKLLCQLDMTPHSDSLTPTCMVGSFAQCSHSSGASGYAPVCMVKVPCMRFTFTRDCW